MNTAPAISISNVEHWNDTFAREHDINDYYARSGSLIRWVERRRLAAIGHQTLLPGRPLEPIAHRPRPKVHGLVRRRQTRLRMLGVMVLGDHLQLRAHGSAVLGALAW